MKKLTTGGGWPAIRYALRTARKVGGILPFVRALQSRNACKTCALGMGGQRGGMVDEQGRFPEVCKKSMQAMAADMQGQISPDFFARYGFAALRQLSPRELEDLGRLVEPVYAGPDDTHYRPISWDDALARCVGFLKETSPEWSFFYSSGRSSNEAGFLMQLFARLYGTNNVNNCSYYCHQASAVGLSSVIGTGTGTIELEDLERCDLIFLIGGNPASNHPRFMRQLVNLRRRGGAVIVVNPLRETGLLNFSVPSDWRSLLFGSEIASLYIQPHIGGDIAFLSGVAKRIEELGAANEAFMRAFTEGSEAFRESIRRLDWDLIVEQSGVEQASIEAAARLYAASSNTVFAWTMGVTHHLHGVDNVRMIANLALLRGMIGRPGAGLLPIRGHSNVQGVGSVGVTPALKQAVFDRLERLFGVKLPADKGLDTLSCVEAMHEGRIRTGWCLGGNLFGATPDARWAHNAFTKLNSIVYLSTKLNTGHAWGRARHTLILPMLARDEEPQPTTQESMFSFVRLSDGGPSRHEGPRSEVATIAAIARGVLGDGGPIDWKALEDHQNIRQAIAAVVPGYEEIGRIDETRREFTISGRIVHRPYFSTPNGKATFRIVDIPSDEALSHTPLPLGGRGQGEGDSIGAGGANPNDASPLLRLMATNAGARRVGWGFPAPPINSHTAQLRLTTIRSEGQFNTVVYEEEDIYRGQERRDVILMNAADIQRLGLHADQIVTVQSETGQMRGIRVREFPIRAGNAAMYYPEANVLTPRTADPESRTPAFKNVLVAVTSES